MLYSIGLASTLSVWPVLYRFGPVIYRCTLSVWACTLSVWPVFYRFGPVLYRLGHYSFGLDLNSIVLACILSVWPVLYRFGQYSIGLARTLSVWPCTLSA